MEWGKLFRSCITTKELKKRERTLGRKSLISDDGWTDQTLERKNTTHMFGKQGMSWYQEIDKSREKAEAKPQERLSAEADGFYGSQQQNCITTYGFCQLRPHE